MGECFARGGIVPRSKMCRGRVLRTVHMKTSDRLEVLDASHTIAEQRPRLGPRQGRIFLLFG